MRLLLAEDNRELAHWLEKALVQNGFAVDCVFDGLAADHLLHSETYALAVLDINMPGIDGLEVVQRLRKRAQTLPVLLLTARSAVADRVKDSMPERMIICPSPSNLRNWTPGCGLCSGAVRDRYRSFSNWAIWHSMTKDISCFSSNRWRSPRVNWRY